jgi:hypothetical protein
MRDGRADTTDKDPGHPAQVPVDVNKNKIQDPRPFQKQRSRSTLLQFQLGETLTGSSDLKLPWRKKNIGL